MGERFFLKITTEQPNLITTFRKMAHYYNQLKVSESVPRIGFEEIANGYVLIYETEAYFLTVTQQQIDSYIIQEEKMIDEKLIKQFIGEENLSGMMRCAITHPNAAHAITVLKQYFERISPKIQVQIPTTQETSTQEISPKATSGQNHPVQKSTLDERSPGKAPTHELTVKFPDTRTFEKIMLDFFYRYLKE